MSDSTATQNLDQFVATGGPPPPWDRLYAGLPVSEDYPLGSRRIGEFVRSAEERFPLPELFRALFDLSVPQRWQEYVLFCLFDTSTPHMQVAKQVLRLKCLRRLLMRRETAGLVSDEETRIADLLRTAAGIDDVENLMSFAFRARSFVASLVADSDLSERQRQVLVMVIRAEVDALSERIRKISDEIDVYNIKEMARILPRVRTFDENARDARDLADAIEQRRPLGLRALTFEAAVKAGDFQAWLGPLRSDPRCAALHDGIMCQRKKLAWTRSIVALASLARWIDEARSVVSHPLDWIRRALDACSGESFSIDAGETVHIIRHFIETAGAFIEGTVVSGNFSDRLYSQWIAPDMLTRPFAQTQAELVDTQINLRDLISSHMANERLLERLLDCSKIYETYGLVEYIATRCRAVKVLSKIATHNYLYAGAANQGVPKALLKNPSPIPMDLLRPFLKPSFFHTVELRTMLRAKELRPEVAQEVRAYVFKQ